MTRQPRTTMPQRGATQSPTRERICSGTAAGSPWSFLVFSAPLLDQFFLPHTPDAQYRTVVYVWYFDRVEFRSGCAVLFCLRLNRLFSCQQVPESCNHPSASNLIENHLFFFSIAQGRTRASRIVPALPPTGISVDWTCIAT